MLALYRSLKFSDFDNFSLKLMRKLWRKLHPFCVLEEPGVNLELLGPLQLPFRPRGASSSGPFSSIKTHSSTDDLVQKPPRLRPDKKIYVPGYTTSTVVCSYPSILWSSREVLSNYKLLRKYRKKNKPFSASKHAGMLWQFNSFTVVWSETSENGKFIPCHPN